MKNKKIILDKIAIENKINRIAFSIIENYNSEKTISLVGFEKNGYIIAEKILAVIQQNHTIKASIHKISLTKKNEYLIYPEIPKENIIVDPGIGFSKDLNQNLEILRNLDVFKNLNLPILIGASRKRFIGEILNEINPKERDIGTLAVSCLCSHFNIDIVRVHDVKMNYQILKVADRIYRK